MTAGAVQLDEFGDIPTDEPDSGYTELEFVSLAEFASKDEETGVPLLGSRDEPLLPVGGILLMYGDGGAGKTTLSLDAAAHLGSGSDWLGISVDNSVRITLIENEGPRGMFRQKVARKVADWNGNAPFVDNVTILEEPWTRFTLRDKRNRSALAEHVSEHGTELVVMGPLATLGMVGGGTPDEILSFEHLLSETRELCETPFAWWIVHHENKAGDVSGAWERVPDVLVHVQARGNGHTNVVWRKARWSGSLHGTSIDLQWADGAGFELRVEVDRNLHTELLAAVTEAGDWVTAREAMYAVGANLATTRRTLSDLTDRGELEFAIGPDGRHRTAHCWRVGEVQLKIVQDVTEGEPGELVHLGSPSATGGSGNIGEPPGYPFRGNRGVGSPIDTGAGGGEPGKEQAGTPNEFEVPDW